MSPSTGSRRSPRRLVAGAAALLLALTGIGLTATAAHAASGDISGHVVDQYGNDVVGLEFVVYDQSATPYVVTTDPFDGTFSVNVTPTPGNYFYYLFDDELDDLGYGYVQQSAGDFLDPTTQELDFGTIVLDRYENIAGTIDNWDPAMIEVYIDVLHFDSVADSWVDTGYDVTTIDGTFSVPAILDGGDYAVHFSMDPLGTAPFLNAFLGGEFDDPGDSDVISAVAGSPETITMTMPPAALVTGHVTADDGATPLSGMIVIAFQESGSGQHVDIAYTGLAGEYTSRARPGETYSVVVSDLSGGPDPYATMVYDGFYGCACQFTPVVSTYSDPATGIDFDLTRESELFFILGELYDTSTATGDELEGIRVHVQQRISGTWTDIAVGESDSSGFFEIVVPRDDMAYRLLFEDHGTVLRILEGDVGPGSASSPGAATPGCFLDTGLADPSWLDSGVLFYAVLGLDSSGGCATTPAPPPAPGTQSGSGRGSVAPASAVESTPTPTPTPTPSATPRPSTSPAPDATAPADPEPASSPDLWWLLWLALVVLLLAIVGVVVYFARRT